KLDRDAQGRPLRLANFDRDGKPAPNREGLISCNLHWDQAGHLVRVDMLDEAGRPVLWGGMAAFTKDYDEAGNVIRVRRLGLDGQLAHGGPATWEVQEIPRNE